MGWSRSGWTQTATMYALLREHCTSGSEGRSFQFAGYDGRPEFNVTGFSQLHQSGTGGVSVHPSSLTS
jgi:hypothetical protein